MSGTGERGREAREAAADWLVWCDRGLSAAEEERFRRWLAADEENVRAWSVAQGTWASFDTPNDHLDEMRRAALRARRPRSLAWLQGAAAAAVVVAAVTAGVVDLRIRSAPDVAAPARTLEARDAVRSVRLPDGGGLTLDAGTTVEVAFSTTRRDVRLRGGRAYFDVAPDASRPFAVLVAGRRVTDVGTAFEVALDGQEVSVVLERGAVSIAQAGSPPVRLAPGRRFRATGAGAGVVDGVDVAQALDWRDGWVEFHDTPLAAALQRVSGRTDVVVRVGDAAAGRVRVSGRFRRGNPERFARALAELYPLKLVRRRGVPTLVGR